MICNPATAAKNGQMELPILVTWLGERRWAGGLEWNELSVLRISICPEVPIAVPACNDCSVCALNVTSALWSPSNTSSGQYLAGRKNGKGWVLAAVCWHVSLTHFDTAFTLIFIDFPKWQSVVISPSCSEAHASICHLSRNFVLVAVSVLGDLGCRSWLSLFTQASTPGQMARILRVNLWTMKLWRIFSHVRYMPHTWIFRELPGRTRSSLDFQIFWQHWSVLWIAQAIAMPNFRRFFCRHLLEQLELFPDLL
jgi:hypothetical protein